MNLERVKRALPRPDEGSGRRSIISLRPDVAEIVVQCVLRTHTYQDIAKRCGVELESLVRFRKKFITDEVKKIVLAESQVQKSADLDEAINTGQDEIQKGLRDILKEQKALYKTIKDKVSDDRDVEDMLPALMQLLRDQGQSFERLIKSYSALKDKTTIVLSLNEHPDVSKLMDVLYIVFAEHPEAFAMFQKVLLDKRVPLSVN